MWGSQASELTEALGWQTKSLIIATLLPCPRKSALNQLYPSTLTFHYRLCLLTQILSWVQSQLVSDLLWKHERWENVEWLMRERGSLVQYNIRHHPGYAYLQSGLPHRSWQTMLGGQTGGGTQPSERTQLSTTFFSLISEATELAEFSLVFMGSQPLLTRTSCMQAVTHKHMLTVRLSTCTYLFVVDCVLMYNIVHGNTYACVCKFMHMNENVCSVVGECRDDW